MYGRTSAKLGLGQATICLATAVLIMLSAIAAQAATAFTGDRIQGLPVHHAARRQ